jgi:hypothetical protein
MIILNDGLNTNQFSFKDGQFTTMYSDICRSADVERTFMRQIYDDAYDVGFAMVSCKTQHVVRFYLADEKKDCEGDVQFWEFKPIAEDVRKYKLASNLKVVVFND